MEIKKVIYTCKKCGKKLSKKWDSKKKWPDPYYFNEEEKEKVNKHIKECK